jgi:predicted dithiol-disulfide oxidoreductase (DUF899 family)
MFGVAEDRNQGRGEITMNTQKSGLPPIVTQSEWQTARDNLLIKEKAHTRARDALAADCRW